MLNRLVSQQTALFLYTRKARSVGMVNTIWSALSRDQVTIPDRGKRFFYSLKGPDCLWEAPSTQCKFDV